MSVDEGEDTGYRIIFKLWDNWDMDYVCVPFVTRTATLLAVSRSTVSHVYQECLFVPVKIIVRNVGGNAFNSQILK